MIEKLMIMRVPWQCAALVFAELDPLLQSVWNNWDGRYSLGGLARHACRDVGKCGGAFG